MFTFLWVQSWFADICIVLPLCLFTKVRWPEFTLELVPHHNHFFANEKKTYVAKNDEFQFCSTFYCFSFFPTCRHSAVWAERGGQDQTDVAPAVLILALPSIPLLVIIIDLEIVLLFMMVMMVGATVKK